MPKDIPPQTDELDPPLTISAESVCYLVIRVRQLDAKEEDSDPDTGSNPSDDKMYEVLEDNADDSVEEEIQLFIGGLSEDEQIDLVAMAWLGRGDGEAADWADLRAEAERAYNTRTSEYLLGLPLLADYLEEALDMFDMSCQEFEFGRL